MATLILRPNSDIHIEHTYDGDFAYLNINEEVPDDATTVMYQLLSSETVTTPEICTSEFGLGTANSFKGTVKSAKLYIYDTCGSEDTCCSVTYNIKLNGVILDSVVYEYQGGTNQAGNDVWEGRCYQLTNLPNTINDNNISNFTFEVISSLHSINTSGKGGLNLLAYILSTVYIEIECGEDIGIHFKQNNSWFSVKQAFRKVNGSWVAISADECRTFLQG